MSCISFVTYAGTDRDIIVSPRVWVIYLCLKSLELPQLSVIMFVLDSLKVFATRADDSGLSLLMVRLQRKRDNVSSTMLASHNAA